MIGCMSCYPKTVTLAFHLILMVDSYKVLCVYHWTMPTPGFCPGSQYVYVWMCVCPPQAMKNYSRKMKPE